MGDQCLLKLYNYLFICHLTTACVFTANANSNQIIKTKQQNSLKQDERYSIFNADITYILFIDRVDVFKLVFKSPSQMLFYPPKPYKWEK